ncbi:MAG: histidine kinase [Nitrospirae bacterium]|nr:MAG: histidine kinase [Nitrospirota bacterium]
MRNCVLALSVTVALGAVLLAPPQTWAGDKEKAVKMVNNAIAYYQKAGKDKAFAEITNKKGRFQDGELYVFVYDLSGNVVAHGQDATLIGKNLLDTADAGGKYFVKERIALVKDKGEGWQDYKFKNPVSGKIEDKTSFVKKHDAYIFGCGVYKK